MISTLREAARLALIVAVALTSSQVAAQQPFYKGKRLAVLVNFAPGGSTDIEGRLFARHIARHLDGEPNVVVQNMDGAGGFNGANYVGEVAPRDGTMLGFMGGTAWQYATDPERFRADLRSYEFIAFQPGTTVYYVRKDVAPGMKEPADIVRATDLIAGGNGVHNARDLLIRLSLDILGVKHRYVTGFRSGQTARLALQRNEVNFYAEPASAYRGAVEAQVIEPGIAIPVYVDPIYNGEALSNSPQVKGLRDPGVPGSLPLDQGRAALRTIVGCLSVRACAHVGNGPPDRAAAAGAGSCGHGAAQRDRQAQQRSGICRRLDESAGICAGLRHGPRRQSLGAADALGPTGDAGIRRRLHQAREQIRDLTGDASMIRSRLFAAAIGVCAAAIAASSAPAQESFYKGKRLTLLVNFDAGSATDIDARVFARHFVKHIDGASQLHRAEHAGRRRRQRHHVSR